MTYEEQVIAHDEDIEYGGNLEFNEFVAILDGEYYE